MRRGRFAPTPSGRLHIGNARTALLAWLQMRAAGGEFVLRLEDIDKPRCRPAFAELMIRDLRWLGLDWDEGPDIGGPYAPYVQSEREEEYDRLFGRLERDGLLYACTCSRAELAAIASAPHGLASEGPAYPGTCRHRTPEEQAARAAVKTPSYRFALPDRPVFFRDAVAGEQHFPAGSGGDFVVKRADGVYAYQLAVVADDAAMRITDVLRGSDLLDSTPRQLLLYEALGLAAPAFAHIPLLYGPDGRRLAKRDDAVMLVSLRENGVPPERVVGWLAYWSGLIERPEPVRPAELVAGFSPDRIPKEPIVVSEEALRHLTSR
ncbi:tRNA glutamyl-Q(34) synthetase GluQRS [Paenibacillus flagellatus]|uniref:Glutamyl-Q tRNA(Asp) synthetase n=1 Tax=Paenibacillus flagellatus TaxID=2211139 RepID=A0A2V5KA49_9BACL|nr:tRNA glutamyl-Q(34) synthetase GluQRS [Paenibacillus flagellatus]PYI55772.1 tRNA glutamyl-Q(34) synthetase GluQRS [Paenibacillus flagellatus]